MAVAFDPAEPMPGDTVTVAVTATIGATSVDLPAAQVRIISVPDGSTVPLGILVDANGAPTLSLTVDVSGEYVINAYGYIESVDFTGSGATSIGFVDDPGYQRQAASLFVGSTLLFPIVTTNGHGLSISLTVHNQITAAELTLPTTEKAAQCLLDSAVNALLDALVGDDPATVGVALPTAVAELITKYNAHRILTGGSVHAAADTTNTYPRTRPYDAALTVPELNRLLAVIQAHMLGSTTATTPWHTADDTINTPLSPPAGSLASALQLFADLAYRCYTRHLGQIAAPAAHGATDATNTLTAIDPLSALIVAILDYFATDSPTVPANANEGALILTSKYGFT